MDNSDEMYDEQVENNDEQVENNDGPPPKKHTAPVDDTQYIRDGKFYLDELIEVAIKAVEEVFDWETYLKENFEEK